MFQLNEDKSIYLTRGDVLYFDFYADNGGKNYKFKPGDVVRIAVYGKKDATNVVLQKDFPVYDYTEKVVISLTKYDTKIGDVISKPVDYWYEIVLNPYDDEQTIIGYDEDGPKLFRLFPEADELDEYEPDPEDIPIVDEALDMTSPRPVANQAIARAYQKLLAGYERTNAAVAELHVTPQMFGAIADGVADDTEAIQTMFDTVESGGAIFFPKGEYAIDSFATVKDGAFGYYGALLYQKKDITITFDKGAILKSIANSENTKFSALLGIVECEQIKVIGGELIGELDEHTFASDVDTTTFTQSGIWINSSKDVVIDGVTAHNFIAACIYVGGSPKSDNVEIRNCTAYHSHYHGIVVEGADNVKIINTTAYDANTNRSFGTSIDIEGVSTDSPNENITVDGCYIGEAEASSLNINKCKNVYVRNTRVEGNKLTIQPSEYVYVSNCYLVNAKLHILQGGTKNVVIDGNKLVNNNIKAQIYSSDTNTIEGLLIRNNTLMFDSAFEGETYGIAFFDVGGYGNVDCNIVGNICKCSSGRIMLVKAVGGSGTHGIKVSDNKFYVGTPANKVALLYRDLVSLSKLRAEFVHNTIELYLADNLEVANGTSTSTYLNLCLLTPNESDGFKISNNDFAVFGAPETELNLLNTYTELTEAPETRYVDYFENKIYSELSNTKGLTIPVNYKTRLYSNIVTSCLSALISTQDGVAAQNNIFDTVV